MTAFILIIIVILFIFLFLFLLMYLNKINKVNKESFTNQGFSIESGVSGISATGTITFKKPFSTIPFIFTQMNSYSSTSTYIYSVNIFNVTNSSFDYAKNQAYNATSTINEESITTFPPKKEIESFSSNTITFSVPKIEQSSIGTFNWIAIG